MERKNEKGSEACTVREANESDAAGIARVHVDGWRESYAGLVPAAHLAGLSYERHEEFWRGVLGSMEDERAVFVAQDETNRVVGFASGGPDRGGDVKYLGQLYAIYVRAPFQRQGLGRRLVARVAERLLLLEVPSMLVWVLRDNRWRRFYVSLGGRELYEKNEVIGGKSLVEIAYGWEDLRVLIERIG